MSSQHRIRVTRRGLQVSLGLLWILDGLLQLQPAMLTARFATEVIAPAAAGQPAFVSWPVQLTARIIGHQPVLADLAFALVQLAIGAGLLYPRTARRALAASVAWALAGWYLGEGLGGLSGGGVSLLTGAPGSALVYAMVSVAAWPPRPAGPGAGETRPARWTAAAWAVLWLGGAVLQVLPGSDTNDSVAVSLTMNATGAPGWLAAIGTDLSALIPYGGVSVVVDLVVVQAFAGAGALLAGRTGRIAVWTGIGLSLLYWPAGQGLGQFWSGLATDPDTAPALILLGAAVLGAAPWRRHVSMTANATGGIVTVSRVMVTPGPDAASTPVPGWPSASRAGSGPRLAAMRSLPRRTMIQRASSSKSALTRSSRGSVSSGRTRRSAISSRYQASRPR